MLCIWLVDFEAVFSLFLWENKYDCGSTLFLSFLLREVIIIGSAFVFLILFAVINMIYGGWL